MYNKNNSADDWLDEATHMRNQWDEIDEEDDEEDIVIEEDEEGCEFCDKPKCEGECQDSGWWDNDNDYCSYDEDPDEYWYGEDE